MLDPTHQRQFAVEVVAHLRAQGFEAYWAGGCVRDQLLNRAPGDYDVATDATPDQIRNAFGRRKTLAIGAAFGVITVVGPKEAGQVEVTTFRQDADYSDGRRPDHVTFSSAQEDAQRRDFTINGLFFDPIAERVIDHVGGVQDLHAGVVRAIGDPHERFREDKLRMLRAVRFAAALDFEIDGATEDAVRSMAPQVTIVSPERIAAEMEKMLVGHGRERALRLLRQTTLLPVILPEVAAKGEADDNWWRDLLTMLDGLSPPTLSVALAVVLRGVSDAALAETVGRRWRLSNHDRRRAEWLLQHCGSLAGARTLAWSRVQPLLIDEGAAELITLHEALARVGACDPDDIEFCRDKLALPPHELNPAPLLTGQDLVDKGIPRGKVYAWLLNEVRNAQLDGKIGDKQSALRLVVELLPRSPE